MNVYVVKIAYTPREAIGLRLTTTIAGAGISAQEICRRWAHENRYEVLSDASVAHSITVEQSGTLVELR